VEEDEMELIVLSDWGIAAGVATVAAAITAIIT